MHWCQGGSQGRTGYTKSSGAEKGRAVFRLQYRHRHRLRGMAYSLAAALGSIVMVVKFNVPAILIAAYVPMLFIAAAYYHLNRADPDCGTSFSWVTRAMGPYCGWMAGWAIIAADILVMTGPGKSYAGVPLFELRATSGQPCPDPKNPKAEKSTAYAEKFVRFLEDLTLIHRDQTEHRAS